MAHAKATTFIVALTLAIELSVTTNDAVVEIFQGHGRPTRVVVIQPNIFPAWIRRLNSAMAFIHGFDGLATFGTEDTHDTLTTFLLSCLKSRLRRPTGRVYPMLDRLPKMLSLMMGRSKLARSPSETNVITHI